MSDEQTDQQAQNHESEGTTRAQRENDHRVRIEGERIEIDHLGEGDPERHGEFAIYSGDEQNGEFMMPWAMEHIRLKARRELPSDKDLIESALLALAKDPRVLTQSAVADLCAELYQRS
jgi:hypothetical protein